MLRLFNPMKDMRTLLLMLFAMISIGISAQTLTLKGNVKDTTGEPVIGASIVEKGNTTNGTITDLDGNFSLKIDGKKTIVISYIGMKTQEIAVQGRKLINVTMSDDSKALDEVVVIGYGTVSKKDLTGSVASVSAKDIAAVPVSSATEALTGKMAGVNITTTEGSPDADIKIRVRGGGSLSQDNSPLYIVDGFPVSSISDIAPSEIQSIDVLKDASSTAIYGARGANGVIIITTKSGKEGKTQVDFGASYGFKKATKFTKVLSPYDYVAYQYELDANNLSNFIYGEYGDLDIWKSVEGTDYQDEIFGRTGNQAQYNVNVSGGSKQFKYNVSYAHNDEKSIMLGSGYRKDNVNAKIKAEVNKWITLDANVRMSYTTTDGLSGGSDTNESNASTSIVANAIRYRPVEKLTVGGDEEVYNQKSPLERLVATYKQRNVSNYNYNAGVNWKPLINFTFRSEFGYGWKYDDIEQAWGSDATQNSNYGYNGQPQAYVAKETIKNWRNSNTLTYENKKLFNGRDRINVLAGHEISSSWSKAYKMVSVGFDSNAKVEDILSKMGGGTALPTQTTYSAKDNLLSFFGRINYTLSDKYLFTATIRADGSSKFAKGNQWGVFPSAAFAWRMSDEAFMSNTRNWLSSLKLRLSYGTAGNNRISSGLINETFSLAGNTSKPPYWNNISNSMLTPGTNLSNPELKWETTITRNLGFDFGFWDNRISGSLDFYWNTTKDLLMRTEIPSISGYNYQYQNFGKTSNKGVELSMNAVLLDKKKYGLNFNFNIAYNRNRIDELNSDNPWQSSNWAGSTIARYEDFRVEKGGQLGEVWGYKTNGYFTAYDPVTNPTGELILNGTTWVLKDGITDNSPTITGGNYYPGGLKVECDANGNPIKQKLGNTVAPVVGGFGLNGRVGNFDFNLFFNYSIGNQIVNGAKLATSFYSSSREGYNLNNDFALANRYTWVDPVTGMNLGRPSSSVLNTYGGEQGLINRLNAINSEASNYNPAAVSTMQLTDYAVEDASFLRVNNITIGYSFPKSWIKKCFMENVRIYVTGYNLFCITKYSGADPEVDTSSKRNAMTPGIDYAAYPKSRSFIGGINVTF
ncbi:SusC/RagA family TonB-linked outer membrane protein [Bacteroides difficilis]|uniref:SusC/RagA family TonB-linked outer membrane protein n=1 Tax=Bacteroides difficilis TaxID=2763021 RepID=UPI003AAC39D3